MKIKQFNEMKAYLLKPKRLFSSKKDNRTNLGSGTIPGGYSKDAYKYIREIETDIKNSYKKYKAGGGKLDFDTYSSEAKRAMFEKDTPAMKAEGGRIGGGTIEGEDLGTREGFKAPKRFETVEGAPGRLTFDTEKQLYRKQVQKTVGGKKTIDYIYSKPGESLDAFLARKPVRATEADDATVLARKFIDNWTKSWFDNNLKNYGVQDFDVMISDLANDWSTRLESGDAPKAKGSFNLATSELKLPNITSLRDAGMKKGAIEPFNYNNVRFYANLESSPTEIGKTLAQYKKIFYKNKIETDTELRSGLNNFFEFMSRDKRGLYRTLDGKTIKEFMNTVSDDVKYLVDSKASGLDKASKNEVFNSYDDLSDNYNKFTQDKARLNAVQRETEAMARAGEKTKEQYLKVKETIKNQNKVLAKMSVEDIASNKQLLNSVRMVINPQSGEVSFTNYTANDPKGKPELNDLELAKKIKQKATDGNFFVVEHISKKSLEKANTAFPNNLQSANYMSNSQLENARRFLLNAENRNTPVAQNLDQALEQIGLTIRGPEYGNKPFGNKIDIVFNSDTGRSTIVDNQLIDFKKTPSSPIDDLLKIEGVTTADKIDRPESAIEADMFKAFNERIANVKNIPVTEVQEDVSKVTKLLNETAGKLNSGADPVFLAKYLKAQGEDIAAFGKKYGGDALNKIIKGTTALDLPIFQVAFASMQDWEEDSPLWVTLPAAFTDYTAKTFNLYEKTGGKAKEFGKFLASSFVPRFMRSPVFKAVSKFGKGASLAAPLLEIGQGVYKDVKQRGMLPEIARQFNIPIEEAKEGYKSYIRDTVPLDAFDELNVPDSPGLPGVKRGFQEFMSLFGLAKNPYKEDPNAIKPETPESFKKVIETDDRDFLFAGGVASLFKKAAQVSEALRRVKNSTFEMWNNVRMFGEQKGVAKNLESFTNIPDKNRKIASIEDIKALKESVPEKYHQDLNIMMRSIEQNNFETAWKEYKKFELDLEPTLKFENIPQEYFPMLDPLNDAFVIEGPRDSFKRGRYQIKTSMEIDKTTGQPTGKYQSEKYDTFDPETRTFRDEPVLVGASTEKGKKGLN